MRTADPTLLDGYSMVNSVASSPIRIEHMDLVSFQCIYNGGTAPTGTLTVQLSNDEGTDQLGTGVTNWTDSDTLLAITDSGDCVLEMKTSTRWARVYYTYTSGTGNLTIKAFAKGVV